VAPGDAEVVRCRVAFIQATIGSSNLKEIFILDVRRLQILVQVARCGSFTAAARALSYTPSAVSQQIAALEREAGATLVVRGPRGVVLTDPGRVLVAGAEEVLGRLAATERELHALAGLRTGQLRLGWFATAGATLMPRAIAAFQQRHPGIRLDLFQGDPDECLPKLRTHELELALVYRFDLEPSLDPDLEQVPLLDDPLHIGLPPGHSLAGQARVRLADLAGERWIQGVRQGRTLEVLPRAARLAGFEPKIAFRTDDRSAVEGLVAAGVGVALFPLLTFPAVRPDVVVRPLEAHGLSRQVLAALSPGAYRPPAATVMVEMLHEVCQALEAEAGQRLQELLPRS
jgi:DNA-binding transcriptional LysR family regulator